MERLVTPSDARAAADAAQPPALYRDGVRGWLLLFTLGLIPHIILSAAYAMASWDLVGGGANVTELRLERMRLVSSMAVLVGHATGVLLILTRNRYTPAFFSLYLPLLLLFVALDPDTIATQVAQAERLGVERVEGSRAQAAVRTVLAVSLGIAWIVYWFRSARVRAVFGSTGLGALRRFAREP